MGIEQITTEEKIATTPANKLGESGTGKSSGGGRDMNQSGPSIHIFIIYGITNFI